MWELIWNGIHERMHKKGKTHIPQWNEKRDEQRTAKKKTENNTIRIETEGEIRWDNNSIAWKTLNDFSDTNS